MTSLYCDTGFVPGAPATKPRSEAHTSALQSLLPRRSSDLVGEPAGHLVGELDALHAVAHDELVLRHGLRAGRARHEAQIGSAHVCTPVTPSTPLFRSGRSPCRSPCRGARRAARGGS